MRGAFGRTRTIANVMLRRSLARRGRCTPRGDGDLKARLTSVGLLVSYGIERQYERSTYAEDEWKPYGNPGSKLLGHVHCHSLQADAHQQP